MKPEPETITWQAHEYNPEELSRDWFIGIGAFGLVIFLIALFTKNFLFALIIILGVGMIGLLGTRKPEYLTFSLTSKGLVIKDQIFLYRNLIAFGLKDHEEPHKLMIHANRLISPHIIINLENIDPEIIRQFLRPILPEVQFEETFIDRLIEVLGF